MTNQPLNTPRLNMKAAFPDFDQSTLPNIPVNWNDSSWHNEPCPSFTIGDASGEFLQVFIDYPETDKREFPEGGRFTVLQVKANGDTVTLYQGDDWQAVERVTLGAEYVDAIGYNPFEDEPTIPVETVRNTLAEFRELLAAERS